MAEYDGHGLAAEMLTSSGVKDVNNAQVSVFGSIIHTTAKIHALLLAQARLHKSRECKRSEEAHLAKRFFEDQANASGSDTEGAFEARRRRVVHESETDDDDDDDD